MDSRDIPGPLGEGLVPRKVYSPSRTPPYVDPKLQKKIVRLGGMVVRALDLRSTGSTPGLRALAGKSFTQARLRQLAV